jgi:PKD repeat protein
MKLFRYSLVLGLFLLICQTSLLAQIKANFGAEITVGCAPFTVFFIDSSSVDVTSWLWDVNNDGVYDYTDREPFHTYTTPGLYSVKLWVGTNDLADSITKVRYIRVIDPPSINVQTPPPSQLCSGDTLSINPIVRGGLRPYLYFWKTSLGLTLSGDSILRYPLVDSDTILFSVVDSLFCEATYKRYVKVNPLPQKPLIMRTMNTLSTNATATRYQWYNDGIPVQGATSREFLITNPKDTLRVKIWDVNGCSAISDSYISIDIGNSVNDEYLPNGWSIYPNPTSSSLTISRNESTPADVVISDVLGNEVLRVRLENELTTINLNELAKGLHILKIYHKNSVSRTTFVKN